MVEVKLLEAFSLTVLLEHITFPPPYPIPRQKNDKLVGLALLARTISLWITLAY